MPGAVWLGLKLSTGKRSQTSPLYVGEASGNAALPVRGWLRCDGVRGGEQPLAEEQVGVSIAERRRSSGLPLAVLAPCLPVFPVPSTLGYPQGALCPSWLVGALLLQSPRLKLLECTRIKVALGFSWDLSCLVSQSQSTFTASGNGTYAAGLTLVLMAFGSTS